MAGVVGMWRMLRHEGVQPASNATAAGDGTYVGSQACAACHPAQSTAWRASQHAQAMADATDRTVLGTFDGTPTTLRAGSGTTNATFSKRDGKFFVRTDGPDGRVADFPIEYTFGVSPLQQYLVRLPGGRLQALGIAWDSRPAKARGQRWFHLYPHENLKAGDPRMDRASAELNSCAPIAIRRACSTTRPLGSFARPGRKSVGCEACHGPGSAHAAAGGKAALPTRFDERKAPIGSRPSPAERRPARARVSFPAIAADRWVRRGAVRRRVPSGAARARAVLQRRSAEGRGLQLASFLQSDAGRASPARLPRPAQRRRASRATATYSCHAASTRMRAGASLSRRHVVGGLRVPHADDHLHAGGSAARPQLRCRGRI